MSTSKNITWKGALNKHLVRILSKEYSKFVAPPSGQSKKSICAGWSKILGVGDKDPTGEKVKQNVDKIIGLWRQANEKRNSTGFGDLVKDDGMVVTTQDQLLAICDVFFELDAFMSNRPIATPKGGPLEGGVTGRSQTQATSPNADGLNHGGLNDLDSPGPLEYELNESLVSGLEPTRRYTFGSFDNPNAVESPPETPVARKKRLNTTKRNYQEVQQQEQNLSDYDPGSDAEETVTASGTPEPEKPTKKARYGGDVKNITDMLAAASEVSKIHAHTAQLRAEAKILQLGGIPSTQCEHLQFEKDKDREVELKRLEVQAEELRVRERLQHEELLYKREELAIRKLEAEARIAAGYASASDSCSSSSRS